MTSSRREFLRNSLTLALFSTTVPTQLLAIFRPNIKLNQLGMVVATYSIQLSNHTALAKVGGSIRLEQFTELRMNPDHCENSGADNMDYPIAVTRVAESGPDAFEAVSTYCTHANAFSVEYDPDQKVFVCPHKQSRFQPDGTHIDGPANGNLRSFPVTFDGVDTITITELLNGCQVLGMKDEGSIPVEAFLDQNSPNPARNLTVIRLGLPKADQIRLSLHTSSGEEARVIFEGEIQGGVHLFDLSVIDLSSGVYYYTLSTSTSTHTRTLTVIA